MYIYKPRLSSLPDVSQKQPASTDPAIYNQFPVTMDADICRDELLCTPPREPFQIIKYVKAGSRENYLVRWRHSVLSGAMLNISIGETALLAEAWKIRPPDEEAFAPPPQDVDVAKLYTVMWRDSWVPVQMVHVGNLINEFWTERYRTKNRFCFPYPWRVMIVTDSGYPINGLGGGTVFRSFANSLHGNPSRILQTRQMQY